jgi:hypothetical protein
MLTKGDGQPRRCTHLLLRHFTEHIGIEVSKTINVTLKTSCAGSAERVSCDKAEAEKSCSWCHDFRVER